MYIFCSKRLRARHKKDLSPYKGLYPTLHDQWICLRYDKHLILHTNSYLMHFITELKNTFPGIFRNRDIYPRVTRTEHLHIQTPCSFCHKECRSGKVYCLWVQFQIILPLIMCAGEPVRQWEYCSHLQEIRNSPIQYSRRHHLRSVFTTQSLPWRSYLHVPSHWPNSRGIFRAIV